MEQKFNIVEQLLGMTLVGTEWVLWLLLFLSVVSIAIALERGWFFIRHRALDNGSIRELASRISAGQLQEARDLCAKNPASVEAAVALEGLEQFPNGPTAMQESMQAYLLRRKKFLDRGLVVLATLGNNAPFIGLFGTVLGIIKAFHDLGLNPQGGASVVMAGISEALVATAVGLFVAIPAVIAFNYFQRLIKVILTDSEAIINTLVAAANSRSAR